MVKPHRFFIVVLILILAGFAPAVSTNQSAPLPGLAESLATITDLLNRGRGIEAENVARAVLARVEELRGGDSLEAAEVLDLLGRAVRRSSTVTNEEKAQFAERAVAIKERVLGPWHPGLATSLTNLALQRTLAADPSGGKPLLERALAIRERAFGPDDLSVAATLGSLAGVLMTLRDDAGAKAVLERTLAIREARHGAAHVETIRTLFKIAIFYAETSDFVGARRHYERALSLAEQVLGARHPMVFDIRLRLAIVFSEGLGDYAASARLNEQLVAEAGQAFSPTDPRLTVALHNLAQDRRDLGDYIAARELAERSLAIAERRFGPKHPEVADSLHTLATVLAAQGAYGEALQAFERATLINEEVRRPLNPEVARASWFIRDLLPVSGYDADDLRDFEQAVAIRAHRTGLADHRVTESLTNLAAILSRAEDYRRTRPLFERALAEQEAVLDPDHPDIAASASNLARVLEHTGDVATARTLYERALRVSEKAFGPDHPNVATALLNLAGLRSKAGDAAEGALLQKRALSIQQRQLGPEHPDVADTLSGLSLLEAHAGAAADAFATAARAEEIRREHVRLTARTLSERQALTYSTSATSALDVMLSVAATRPDDQNTVTAAWDAVMRSRGLVLDEMAARHRVASTTEDPEIRALTASLASARQRLAAAVVRGIRNDPPERYRRLLDQARGDKDRAERDLAAKSAPFRDNLEKSRISVAELVASLPTNGAVVGFARYRRYDAGPDRQRSREGELSYLAFVLRGSQSAPAVVPLGAAATLEALIARWRQQINQEALAGGRATPRSEAAYQAVAGELRRQVWDPLLPYLANTTQVFIVPDGALHLVSFAALPTAARYLVETGPLIHYVSAERDLMGAASASPAAGGLLAIGNPAFDVPDLPRPATRSLGTAQSGCIELGSTQFEPLPASLNEVDDVVTLWSRARRATTRLTGSAASEAAFKSAAAGRQVLHLATHGFFLGGPCATPSDASSSAPAERTARLTRENPLLLSGLILAGPDGRGAADEDGVLTAEEIAALNLSGVEWAVLSGCDTGVGEIRAGEGVFGLRRAFQVAGVKTVIMSLWTVEDQATRQWMAALYENRLVRKLGTAEAVREASVTMVRQRRAKGLSTHPLYWAAFVASGDWR